MKFRNLFESIIIESKNNTYKIYINGLSNKDRKQDFLNCIKELIEMDKYEIEIKDKNRQKLPDNSLDKSFTYSKYDVLFLIENLKYQIFL